MEIQREKDRVVELTNDNKKYRSLKKVSNYYLFCSIYLVVCV